jgi:hypothetical protein
MWDAGLIILKYKKLIPNALRLVEKYLIMFIFLSGSAGSPGSAGQGGE